MPTTRHKKHDIDELRAQNKRLRDALRWFLHAYRNEFIADPLGWQKAKAAAEEKAR